VKDITNHRLITFNRFYKKIITQSNHRDVERTLLTRENVQQTIRFVLGGSFVKSEPNTTGLMRRLNQQCPTLFNYVLPHSEQSEEDSNETSLLIISDSSHNNPTALSCIARNFAAKTLGLPMRVNNLETTHPFKTDLRHAYHCDYEMEHLVQLGSLPLQWCKKLGFDDP